MTDVDELSSRGAVLAEAYQQYGRMVYNVCRRMLNDPQAAEDAMQAVFLIFVRKAPTLDVDTQLGGWFQRTAELVAREGRRSNMRRQRHEHDAADWREHSSPNAAANEALWRDLRPKLDGAIAALPEKYRTPLVLVYLAGKPQKEVAKFLRLNEGTLRWRLSHAIERLRKRLGDSRYSVIVLLLLIESFGTADAPPAHILPSLLNATTPPSTLDLGGVHVSDSVMLYLQGGMKAMFWKRIKLWIAGAASFFAVAALIAAAFMGHRNSAAEESTRGSSAGPGGPRTVAESAGENRQTSAAPADNAETLKNLPKSMEGLPIRDIQIAGVPAGKLDAIARMIQTRKDQPFAQKTLDADTQHLIASGKFAQAAAAPVVSGGGVRITFTLVERDPGISEFGSGPPQMISNQMATPNGGRIVLYSRNRYGNYPLATYSFIMGLRGDDVRVRNFADLVFGNANRPDRFMGTQVDGVPKVDGVGPCGMDGGAHGDTFRVSLYGGCRHTILDLGETFETAGAASKQMRSAGEYADVKANHVYIVRLMAEKMKPLYIKLKVLQHNDNEGVIIDWEPMQSGVKNDDEF